MRIKRVLVVAGGTGGHIWPAIAFGSWLRERHSDVDISFVSGSRPLELKIYREVNLDPHIIHLEGSPLGGGLRKMPRRWKQIFKCFHQARDCIEKEAPDVCLMFGGYVSFPALMVSKMMGLRCLIHEQNAVAGRVTRLAALLGVPVASGWDTCHPLKDKSYKYVGVPIRGMQRIPRPIALRRLGISVEAGSKVALVLGGSLGSGSLFEKVIEASKDEYFSGWTFLIIGASSVPQVIGKCILMPHTWDMEALYSVTDVVITRGGASSLTEIKLWKLPCVIIPWRDSSGGHQRANAVAFCRSARGLILDEELVSGGLGRAVESLLNGGSASSDLIVCGTTLDEDLPSVTSKTCCDLWEMLLAL
ncbi:UDP-N-acetylglucosamine:LPS N-acetylglucosamine transferase [Thermanaerovibrio velox DSM 12556]|uniref:UDP-N-acetylglucosamine:LPS N-acetylglucosamine transferase n=1 Tax=Thermanaerovibrio velox DSM 12556 TaxID=926567 RepID=H0URR2_9BACT|nr:UDP-N-acetylglucosamine--LPS N-acetylglucosamine transferase [Thermanaerovibrio velox]EHM10001.1 UDP-N-acetylglucosamine:LPS N-acetylglucosamine transferase [Thermanaerovibrio velox DSM 12556]